MKILVTGAAGNIGTNLCNELRSRGHKVIGCDLYNTEREDYIRCDVKNFRQIQQVVDNLGKFDFVYHLAAEYGRWNGEAYYENLWMTNMIGTKNILQLQNIHSFKMVFFSSCEVYGDYQGFMTEDVMIDNKISDTFQMNDYAITKWAGELMCLNAATMNGNQIVRVRPLNCYGPHEEYTPYRGFIPKFIYLSLTGKPYTVYEGHKRIIDYVEDSCKTFANITDNFIQGEVYNVGGKVEWEMDIKEYSDIVLDITKGDRSLVTYEGAEDFTTKIKTVDFSKAIKDLNHNPIIDPVEGITRTTNWMKIKYGI